MPKTAWFGFGFAAAVVLIGALALGPLLNISADDAVPLPPTGDGPPEPGIEPASRPTATLNPALLSWWREGELTGRCDHLSIDVSSQVHYAPCDEGPRLARLRPDELAAHALYSERFAPFEHAVQQAPDDRPGVTIRLAFVGHGVREPSEPEKAQIAQWASTLYDRVTSEEQRADLVALARLHLAQRLGVSIDAISTALVESVTWPDACLAIRVKGSFCAQVPTPGYRILLQSQGTTYEYHTDLHGLVRDAGAKGS